MMFRQSRTLAGCLVLAAAFTCSSGWGNRAGAQEPVDTPGLPLSSSSSLQSSAPRPLTFAQQKARFESEQRTLRMEWNKWIGHSPLRPAVNADLFMGDNSRRFYIPSRGVIIGNYPTTYWYW